MQTPRTARTVGLLDRGVVAPGMRADLNVIDLDGLRLRPPAISFDLPAGGKRFLQRADGYLHTFVAGEETYANGESTGALPGRLIRGAQPAPGLSTLRCRLGRRYVRCCPPAGPPPPPSPRSPTLPATCPPQTTRPLVVFLHGCTQTAGEAALSLKNPQTNPPPPPPPPGQGELESLAQITRTVAGGYGVDPARTFILGISSVRS